MAGEDLSFTLSWADIDAAILPPDAREPGTEPFRRAVVEFLRQQYEAVGGKARIVFNDAENLVAVHWVAPQPQSLEQRALDALNRRDFATAVPLLKAVIAKAPNDPTHLYNLGMVYSDQGRLADAVQVLSLALTAKPGHINSLVALGVVHARGGDLDSAIRTLRHALRLEPGNSFAQQNLSACLLKQGNTREAAEQFRASLRSDPANVQSQIGLAQALETEGQLHDADEVYQSILKKAGHGQASELAKEGRTRIAHALLRRTGDERPDVVMYCLGALERYQAMAASEIETIGREIAILGMKGLDINDPAQKYTLKSLPGSFSGLHLLSLMYCAFKQVKPEADVGVDFSSEYARAQELHGSGRG
jgi:cytochrome c-type biogenesis protein CcmH/NrfG